MLIENKLAQINKDSTTNNFLDLFFVPEHILSEYEIIKSFGGQNKSTKYHYAYKIVINGFKKNEALITKSTAIRDELQIVKFLWILYSNNEQEYIERDKFRKFLRVELGNQDVNAKMISLFERISEIPYIKFKKWILKNKEATVLSQYLFNKSDPFNFSTFSRTIKQVCFLFCHFFAHHN